MLLLQLQTAQQLYKGHVILISLLRVPYTTPERVPLFVPIFTLIFLSFYHFNYQSEFLEAFVIKFSNVIINCTSLRQTLQVFSGASKL